MKNEHLKLLNVFSFRIRYDSPTLMSKQSNTTYSKTRL